MSAGKVETKSIDELTAEVRDYVKDPSLRVTAWSGKVLAVEFSGGDKTTVFSARTRRIRRLMRGIGYHEHHFGTHPCPIDVLDPNIVRDYIAIFERDEGWAEYMVEKQAEGCGGGSPFNDPDEPTGLMTGPPW